MVKITPKDNIVIKGTKEGLIFHFNIDQGNLKEILTNLDKKLADGAALIANSQYSIADEEAISQDILNDILQVFAKHNMVKADIKPVIAMPKSAPEAIAPIVDMLPKSESGSNIMSNYTAQNGDSVLLYRCIRSGQSLHIEGNVIILGDVNAGAHIMATGNIVIMGKLKGLAHAGIHGDRSAYIVAWQMEAIQIRIADMVSRSDDGTGQDIIDYPEIAVVENGGIVIKPYSFSKSIYQKKVVIA